MSGMPFLSLSTCTFRDATLLTIDLTAMRDGSHLQRGRRDGKYGAIITVAQSIQIRTLKAFDVTTVNAGRCPNFSHNELRASAFAIRVERFQRRCSVDSLF